MNSFSSIALSVVALFAVVGGAGCAADGATDLDPNDATTSDLTAATPRPSAASIAGVTANGSGCPRGTWTSNVSPDGKSVTIDFGRYEAEVREGQFMAVADCNIMVDVRAPRGLSFAVKHLSFDGAVELDSPGMTATATAKTYFQGSPAGVENRSEFVGPVDDALAFNHDIADADLVFSPCGAARQLTTQTRAFVQNNSRKTGTGSVKVSGEDLHLRLDLAWRTC